MKNKWKQTEMKKKEFKKADEEERDKEEEEAAIAEAKRWLVPYTRASNARTRSTHRAATLRGRRATSCSSLVSMAQPGPSGGWLFVRNERINESRATLVGQGRLEMLVC